MKTIITVMVVAAIVLSAPKLLSQDNSKLINHYASYSVRVQWANFQGSGFFLQWKDTLYFVTAHHVLCDKKGDWYGNRDQTVELWWYPWSPYHDYPQKIQLRLTRAEALAVFRNDVSNDCSVLPIAALRDSMWSYLSYAHKSTSSVQRYVHQSTIKTFVQASVGEDSYLYGYPASLGIDGLAQFDRDRPLVRRGMIAGKFKEQGSLIIDAPAFYGNSGGPAFTLVTTDNGYQLWLIGYVVEFVPFDVSKTLTDESSAPGYLENSGYSIVKSCDHILSLIGR